jgi:hypothetical protein
MQLLPDIIIHQVRRHFQVHFRTVDLDHLTLLLRPASSLADGCNVLHLYVQRNPFSQFFSERLKTVKFDPKTGYLTLQINNEEQAFRVAGGWMEVRGWPRRLATSEEEAMYRTILGMVGNSSRQWSDSVRRALIWMERYQSEIDCGCQGEGHICGLTVLQRDTEALRMALSDPTPGDQAEAPSPPDPDNSNPQADREAT